MVQLIYLPLLLGMFLTALLETKNNGNNGTGTGNTTQQYSINNCTGGDTGLRFCQDAKIWIDALMHCLRENSSLVHITNKTVQNDVECLLEKTNLQKGVWIGLERSIFGCSVPWKWTSGTEVEDAQWKSSNRVDPVNNNCGKIIFVEPHKYKWQDAHCYEKLPFICQDAAQRLYTGGLPTT